MAHNSLRKKSGNLDSLEKCGSFQYCHTTPGNRYYTGWVYRNSNGALTLESPDINNLGIQFGSQDGYNRLSFQSVSWNPESAQKIATTRMVIKGDTGFVGIGTPAPGTTLDVVGTGKFSSNLTVDTNTLYVDATNHRVGIGTTTPERRIDQVGSIVTGYSIRSQISNGVTVFPNTAWVTFEAKNQNQTAGNSVGYGFFTNDASGNDNYAAGIAAVFTARAATNVNADIAFTVRNGAEGHFERMRILSGGKIGIGTPAPTELLHVNGNIRTMVGGVVYTDTVSGMNCTFNIKTAGTGDPILFSQGYAERMRIWNGRVGIGTTTPAKTLDVAGAAQFSASTEAALLLLAQTDTTASQLNLQPFNGSNGSIIYTTWRTGSGVLQFAAGNQYPTMTLADTGRLGIGTPAPDAKLHLFGTGAEFVAAHFQNGSGGSGIATIKIGGGTPEVQYGILGEYGVDNSFRIGAVGPAGNHNLQFHTGNTSGTQLSSERMRITADGKIGIGTPTPTERLDVNGNVNVSGTLRAAEV